MTTVSLAQDSGLEGLISCSTSFPRPPMLQRLYENLCSPSIFIRMTACPPYSRSGEARPCNDCTIGRPVNPQYKSIRTLLVKGDSLPIYSTSALEPIEVPTLITYEMYISPVFFYESLAPDSILIESQRLSIGDTIFRIPNTNMAIICSKQSEPGEGSAGPSVDETLQNGHASAVGALICEEPSARHIHPCWIGYQLHGKILC